MYNDPEDIDAVKLAKELHVSQQKVAGHIRSAKNNLTITEALIKKGDSPPRWFAGAEQLLKRSYNAQETVNAAQIVETHASLPRTRAMPTHDRSAALSRRSAPPTHTYWILQPEYQRPAHPYLDEMSRLIIEAQKEDIRESLERMKQRREPTSPMIPNEFKVLQEVVRINNYMEYQRNTQAFFMMNMLRSGGNSKPIDVDELARQLSKPLEEHRSKTVAYDANESMEKAFEFIGRMFEDSIPKMPSLDNLLQEVKAAARERRESDRKAMKELVKIIAENRKRSREPLELHQREQRRMLADFYENFGRIWRGN